MADIDQTNAGSAIVALPKHRSATMATTRYYDKDGNEIAPPRPPLLAVILSYASWIGMLLVIGAAIFIAWPLLVATFQARMTGQVQAPIVELTPQPTMTIDQAAAAAEAARLRRLANQEQQDVDRAVPTANTQLPPPLPADATAATINQPIVAADESRQYSPVDLGWAPLPTPTTMLNQEQYDASQASEEMNFLNNAQQGLTEAQKLVQVHEAEQHAQGRP